MYTYAYFGTETVCTRPLTSPVYNYTKYIYIYIYIYTYTFTYSESYGIIVQRLLELIRN